MTLLGLDPKLVFGSVEAAAAALKDDLEHYAGLWALHTGKAYPVLKLGDDRPGGFFDRMYAALEALVGCGAGKAVERFVHMTFGPEHTQSKRREGSMQQHPDNGNKKNVAAMSLKPCIKLFFDGDGLQPGKAAIKFVKVGKEKPPLGETDKIEPANRTKLSKSCTGGCTALPYTASGVETLVTETVLTMAKSSGGRNPKWTPDTPKAGGSGGGGKRKRNSRQNASDSDSESEGEYEGNASEYDSEVGHEEEDEGSDSNEPE